MSKKFIYPLSFASIVDKHNWGEEWYLFSDLGFRDSEVVGGWLDGSSIGDIMETYLERVVGEANYYFYGRQFPVMIKRLKIRGNYGLRVCPDDVIAAERYDSLGKRKIWYILDVQGDAYIYKGVDGQISAENFYQGCKNGKILNDVHKYSVSKGDCFEIIPGEIHGASGNLDILEISESSDMDFVVYDWGYEAESCEKNAVDCLDYVRLSSYVKIPEGHGSDCGCHEHGSDCGCHEHGSDCGCHEHGSDCGCHEHGSDCGCHEHGSDCGCHEHGSDCGCYEHGSDCGCHEHGSDCGCHEEKLAKPILEANEFNINKLDLTNPIHVYTEKFNSFILYYCIKGEVSVNVKIDEDKQNILESKTEKFILKSGNILLVPADCPDYLLVPLSSDNQLFEIVLPHRNIEDLLETTDFFGEKCDCCNEDYDSHINCDSSKLDN